MKIYLITGFFNKIHLGFQYWPINVLFIVNLLLDYNASPLIQLYLNNLNYQLYLIYLNIFHASYDIMWAPKKCLYVRSQEIKKISGSYAGPLPLTTNCKNTYFQALKILCSQNIWFNKMIQIKALHLLKYLTWIQKFELEKNIQRCLLTYFIQTKSNPSHKLVLIQASLFLLFLDPMAFCEKNIFQDNIWPNRSTYLEYVAFCQHYTF